MSNIKLTYVLTTYNKLPYLKEVILALLDNCKNDEEVIVVDGGSSDGTFEYLQTFYDKKKINYFISEKDFGEAHGYNKGMLLANGELIKLISDDDVFHYPSIAACRKFMLSNPDVDILNCSGGWGNKDHMNVHEFTNIYVDFFKNNWMLSGHPFSHCGLGLMMRRSSIPKIGLLNLGFVRTDAEFTLRFTSNKVNFFWYTGVGYVRILNPESNSSKMKQKIHEETSRLNRFYGFDIDTLFEDVKQPKLKALPKKLKIPGIRNAFTFLKNKIRNGTQIHIEYDRIPQKLNLSDVYRNAEQWLQSINDRENIFIGND